jgi:hypothetical protein
MWRRAVAAKTVTTTDELVMKAAATCPDAKRVLKELFPEVFRPVPLKVARSTKADNRGEHEQLATVELPDGDKATLAVRGYGKYANAGLYVQRRIAETCDVKLERDEHGEYAIVFTPKETK